MEYYRRSGFDRRESISDVHSERRTGEERRELIVNEKKIIGELRETPIFNKLTNSEFKNILAICSKQTFSKGEFIYQEGKKSEDMYILIDGILKVTLKGSELSLITPIDVIGEMGLFSHEPRSATINAETDCVLLKLTRVELFRLYAKKTMLSNRFYLGMIINLSDKLRKANEFIVELKK
jgi:CRP-like cAMP-binding protein